jgi:hypothetical protein
MSAVADAADQILSIDKTIQHWLLHHELIRALLQMDSELVGLPSSEFYLFVTKCVELLGPAEGVALLQLIDQGSYFRLLSGPAFIVYPCLKMVGLFILWDRAAAELFSDNAFFMRLSCSFDHERGAWAMELAWMTFCHALIYQGRQHVVHLLLDDGTIWKSAFFMDLGLELDQPYLYLHLIYLMIESSETVDIKKEVRESLSQVSEIWAVIDELISEDITASLPGPIGEISISAICAEIRDFVVQWQEPAAVSESGGQQLVNSLVIYSFRVDMSHNRRLDGVDLLTNKFAEEVPR